MRHTLPMLDLWLKTMLWWVPDPVIAPLTPDDAAEAAALHAACFHAGWPAGDIAAMALDGAVMASVLRRHAGGPMVGLLLVRRAADEAEIITVAVSPQARGRGHAGRLLDALWPQLMRRGVKRVFLEVDAGNEPALKLYRRHGFAEIGRRKGYYAGARGARQDALSMRRDLPSI